MERHFRELEQPVQGQGAESMLEEHFTSWLLEGSLCVLREPGLG